MDLAAEMPAVTARLIMKMFRSMQADSLKDFFKIEFQASHVEVIDDSEKHRNHAGVRETGGGHYKVLIVSDFFAGMSRIERHRKVAKFAMERFPGQIHALSIQAVTPEEMI